MNEPPKTDRHDYEGVGMKIVEDGGVVSPVNIRNEMEESGFDVTTTESKERIVGMWATSCIYCRYFFRHSANHGQCRRRSPIAYRDRDGDKWFINSTWPIVYVHQSCGEFDDPETS